LNLPTVQTAEEIYAAAAASGARPDPLLTISEWADQYRILSTRASAEPGPWRTDRTPFIKEIMDCLSPSSNIERVVAAAEGAAQGTGTRMEYEVIHGIYNVLPNEAWRRRWTRTCAAWGVSATAPRSAPSP
jgi:phage terminase large subunit GpA-like protein